MGKKLINRQNADNYICREDQKIYLDQSMVLSPSGKDYLQEKGIKVVYGCKPQTQAKCALEESASGRPDLRTTIQNILKKDYGIEDASQVSEITSQVLRKLKV